MKSVCGLIKGQCSHSLRAMLKQESDFDQKDGSQDVLWLMEKVEKITSGLDSKSNKRCNLFDALLFFITMKQGENESDSACMKRFRVKLDALFSAGGNTSCAAQNLWKLRMQINRRKLSAKWKRINSKRLRS